MAVVGLALLPREAEPPAGMDNPASPVRVIGLAGSPRRNGNTEALLDRFLAGAADCGAQVEKVVLARLKVKGCVACDECHETGACAIRDAFRSSSTNYSPRMSSPWRLHSTCGMCPRRPKR